MQISSASGTYSAAVLSLLESSGRFSIPVKSEHLLYSRFKHISGVQSPGEEGGVPISRISILNALIDRLRSIDREVILPTESEYLSSSTQENLIQHYAKEMQEAIRNQDTGTVEEQVLGILVDLKV